ncbi:hypothetical protein N7492_010311 [Penicillium capsulatum]|uniref:Zn(2)-C6 fungal-type domain-containing protein n=1 Tax=Penicillium capsulatum TaxID=69766 RepID=A0A9W9LDS4_9EURO|nr:hypothetical protein N7492_010311 [Penicillium capsulatum]
MVEARKRHCWECLRRRLVCDFEVPGCKRCAKSGVDCPGYGETPPMRVKWIGAGKPKTKAKAQQHKGASNSPKSGNAGPKSTSPEESHAESPVVNLNQSDDIQKLTLRGSNLKTDFHALIDSVEYYNSCIYPELANVLRFGTNANIYKLSPAAFHTGVTRPAHLQFGLVCFTLSHRMNQLGHDQDSMVLKNSFYRYRSFMIRSLNEDISEPAKRYSDFVLAGILTVLLADSQEGISNHWRNHIEGVRRLIILRGGMKRLAITPGVRPIIVTFVYLVVLSDTTSPASDMLLGGLNVDELYGMVKEYGGNGSGFQMCPMPLITEIIKTNHIRTLISKRNKMDANDDLQSEAREVLRRVYAFSPTAWTESNEYLADSSKHISETYQSAVALYCMSSLQSVGALPPHPLLKRNRDVEARILHGLIEKSLSQRCAGYNFWPMLVLGVQAVNGSPSLRAFVRDKMVVMSAICGTYAPLRAKDILEQFWASGKDEWDDCFDKPYMLTTILTVNRGQLPRKLY